MLELNRIYNMDCLEGMKMLDTGCIDLTVTSPPYDDLRTYSNDIDKTWNENVWKPIIKELYRITKEGGVVVWVVGDATINGSETGTSFKQALWAMECGFKLYDTMIYQKQTYVPLTHRRYEQEFEYMFVFSKGKPKTFNPIKVPCKYAGTESWGEPTFHKTNDSGLVKIGKTVIGDFKQHGNIFCYMNGRTKETQHHPAPFPMQLAVDNITTWSNEGDIVFDPFTGSGTTLVSAIKNKRDFIGFELNSDYCKIADARILVELDVKKHKLF